MDMDSPAIAHPWRHRAVTVAQSLWFRVIVTGGLLSVVASQIDWRAMGDRIAIGRPEWCVVAVLLIVGALTIGAVRWRALLRVADLRLTLRQIGRVYAVSTFSSTFLPTSVGGDVARALLVARRGRTLARVSLTVVLDRIAAFAGLVLVALVACAADSADVPGSQVRSLIIVSALCVAFAAVGGAAVLRPPVGLVRRLPTRFVGGLREMRGIVVACLRTPLVGLAVLVASLAYQALVALQLCAIARAFSIDLPFVTAAVAVALVTLATLVPISIAGFGIREGTYIVLLGASGVSATDATLISLTSVAVLFVASLPGAYLLARYGTKPALEPL